MAENSKNTDINFYEVHSDTGLDSIKNNPDYESSFIHLHKVNEDKEDNLYIGDCRMTDNFNTRNVPDKAKTMQVGGLEPTTIEELKRMSLSEIVMQIVCPKTRPEVLSNPSMSISYSGEKLIRVGTILPTNLSINENITCFYNKGEWTDKTPYGGEPNIESKSFSMSPDKWGQESEEGQYIISGSVDFGEGPIPKDSYGNPLEGQYTGGNVLSNKITITSVYPIYATTYFASDEDKKGDITRLIEQPLQDYISNETISFYIRVPIEEDGNLNKFKIGIPYSINDYKVNQYNEVSGKYDIPITMEDMKSTDVYPYHYYIRTKDKYDTNGIVKYEIKLIRNVTNI